MPVIGRYTFDDAATVASDSALGNGPQDGIYVNGATVVGGVALLDGTDDLVKVFAQPDFQLARGTVEIEFSQTSHVGTGPNTILSRDSAGNAQGAFRIDVLVDGSIIVAHETGADTESFGTPPGFLAAGDAITISYSWDAGGTGGRLVVQNLTSGAVFDAPVPPSLTMDMSSGGQNQPWVIGAGQTNSDPGLINNIDQHFQGSVGGFSISDTVDNAGGALRDGIVRGTADADVIDTAYIDPFDADRIDAGDAIVPGDDPNDDRVIAGDGNDTVLAGVGDDTVLGGFGDDSVDGGVGNDDLLGNEGDDTLLGRDGADLAFGGDGDDLIDTSSITAPLPDRGYPGLYDADANPLDDLDTVYGGDGADTIRTGDDADLVFGEDGSDNIDGGIDDDSLYGGAAADTIIGGEGSDLIGGDTGDDLIYGGLSPAFPDAINIPDTAGDLRPDNGRDTISGDAGNDTIFGLDDADLISGGIGNDALDGGVDNDTITGDAGNDRITGGQGTDNLTGGDDRDTFVIGAQIGGAGDVIDGSEGGDDFDTLDLRGAGPLSVAFDPANAENGVVSFFDTDGNVASTLTFSNIENIIPCFTPGTLIATPRGEVLVQDLRIGQKIITRDNGIQEIRWIGHRAMPWRDFVNNPHLKPILVRQGSLGHGLPERDMMVSPNHRLLVANDRTALYFDEHEVLVAAKHLIGGDGVHAIESIGTTYIHFMFDQHEVVLSNGAWTESFQPGDYTLKGMGNSQRSEIYELFPELKTKVGLKAYTAARRTLKRHEARLLVT